MGLNDLLVEIKQDPNSFLGEEAVENKVLRQVLQLVEDKISEVKNQAVKWYGITFVSIYAMSLTQEIVLDNSSRSSESLRWCSLSIN